MEEHPHPVAGAKGAINAMTIGLVAHALVCAAQVFLEVMEDDGVLCQRLLNGGSRVWDVNEVDDGGWLPTV